VIAAHANATLCGRAFLRSVKSYRFAGRYRAADLTANNSFRPDVKELIAYAKAVPAESRRSSSARGAPTTERSNRQPASTSLHSLQGHRAGALQDLMGGNIQIWSTCLTRFLMPPGARRQDQGAGDVFSNKRISSAPEVPTMAEAGGPALESSTWVCSFARRRTPRHCQAHSAEVGKAIAASDIKTRFDALGIEPGATLPSRRSKFLADRIWKWSR
jgi:tripartite-type tricarboxylate transporter receptor subunit TctC